MIDIQAICARRHEHEGREGEALSGRMHRAVLADVDALLTEVWRLNEVINRALGWLRLSDEAMSPGEAVDEVEQAVRVLEGRDELPVDRIRTSTAEDVVPSPHRD